MKDYLLHTLSPGDFETLVVKLCHQILGLGTISFSTGKDGGRDAFFEGTAQRFPSNREPWTGKFVIQAKHTEKADASCSDSDFARLLKKGDSQGRPLPPGEGRPSDRLADAAPQDRIRGRPTYEQAY